MEVCIPENYWIYADLISNDHTHRINPKTEISKDNWKMHYNAILNILRDGIDDPIVSNAKIIVDWGGNTWAPLVVEDYFFNIIMWRMFVDAGMAIEPYHIFFNKYLTTDAIKNYIDTFFISKVFRILPNILVNNIIANMLDGFKAVDEFALYLTSTIDLYDLNVLAKQCFLFENIFCIIRCYPF